MSTVVWTTPKIAVVPKGFIRGSSQLHESHLCLPNVASQPSDKLVQTLPEDGQHIYAEYIIRLHVTHTFEEGHQLLLNGYVVSLFVLVICAHH